MGIRFWIETTKIPEFSLQVQLMRLNEQYEGRWFFQDEWGELGLLNILGYNKEWFKARGDQGDHKILTDPQVLLEEIVAITERKMEEFFFNSFDRPTPFWDQYQLMAINYMRLKRRYVVELMTAGCKSAECRNVELPPMFSQWYFYRDKVAVNRPQVYDKIAGKISRTNGIKNSDQFSGSGS